MSHTTPSLTALQQLGFYPDIIASMEGFMQFMHDNKMCKLGLQIVETYASGYLTANEFSIDDFTPSSDDEFHVLKTSYLEALKAIHERFGDRLPRHFYDTLAFMVLRQDPTREERIPELEHLLPGEMDWKTADAVLHAMPLCSRLYFDVQTVINKKTGRILGHGCGCSCAIAGMPTCVVSASMGDKVEIVIEETESFLRHLLGQCFLLHFGLPQGMGASVKMNLRDLRATEKNVLKQTVHS